jgi:hypothetical protein
MAVLRRALPCFVLAAWPWAALAAQSAAEAAAAADLAAMMADWRAAQKQFRETTLALVDSPEYLAAIAAGDAQRMRALRERLSPPAPGLFGARAFELARKHDDEGAVFVVAAAQWFADDPAVAKEAAELLGGRHVMHPAILKFMERPTALFAALGWEQTLSLLGRIEEAHEGAVVSAWAKFWTARSLVTARMATEDSPRVVALLADAERLAAGTMLAERIAAPRFQRERLQPGMPVPDIVGEDMAGKPMRLLESTGNVVVVWFWSFSNSYTRSSATEMTQLEQRLDGQPFAVVGVNCDTNKDYYERMQKQVGVKWRSFWDGPDAQLGPIATRWNVRSWPTYYVIDHEGVIQFHGIDFAAMEKVLPPLLQAAKDARAADR